MRNYFWQKIMIMSSEHQEKVNFPICVHIKYQFRQEDSKEKEDGQLRGNTFFLSSICSFWGKFVDRFFFTPLSSLPKIAFFDVKCIKCAPYNLFNKFFAFFLHNNLFMLADAFYNSIWVFKIRNKSFESSE